jgi:hypothetical protein
VLRVLKAQENIYLPFCWFPPPGRGIELEIAEEVVYKGVPP